MPRREISLAERLVKRMSKRVQQAAADRRDAAIQRAGNAYERAGRNRKRGEALLADRHKDAGDAQKQAAAAAESQRRADVNIEGDQLKPDRGILADDE